MRARIATLALAFAAGCGADGSDRDVLRLQLDYPPPGSPGDPWTDIDELRLSVARAGEATSLAETTFALDDPAPLGGIPFGADLVVHLYGEESDLERSYGRSCALDVDPGLVDAVHLYFARQRSWGEAAAPAGSPPRYSITMPDGSALFGGPGGLERFDPIASGGFAPVAGSLLPREGGVLVAIRDRALLLGGSRDDELVGTVELLLPAPVPQDGVTLARAALAAVTLADGSVLVTGGEEAGGAERVPTADARILLLEADSVIEDPTRDRPRMTAARAGHTATRLGGEIGAEVLVLGGRDAEGGFAASVELYEPFRNAFVTLPSMLERYGHVAVRLPGGPVLVVGGHRPDGAGGALPATEFLLYDPVLGQFSSGGSMPLVDIDEAGDGRCGSPTGAEDDRCATQFGVVDFTATPLPDGNVLIAGGRQAVDTDFDLVPDTIGEPVRSAYVATLEEVGGAFVAATTSSMATARAGHTAVDLCDGTILVVGGAAGGGPTAERYNPRSDIRR